MEVFPKFFGSLPFKFSCCDFPDTRCTAMAVVCARPDFSAMSDYRQQCKAR